jgi:glutamyl-tRNA synthetase
LFNYLVARGSPDGRFLLRIEDTDRGRNIDDSVAKILSDLRWLGLQWDEGPEVGGDFGPYYQSERLPLYTRYAEQLLDEGKAYFALETSEELAAARVAAKDKAGGFKYRRPDPLPTRAQADAARAAGRSVVVRLMMPGTDITVVDDILGQVTLTSDELEDFVIVKSDGWPTFHFANVVDDALMKVTHVLRGQEHLMNTPKHIALQRALGFPTPRYGHLPIIFNPNGTKMSKRDKEKALQRGEVPPEIDVHDFRTSGYLPEALLNFLSLLGWSPGDDTEQMTLEETTRRFQVTSINRGNSKFDRDKLLSFNTTWAGRLPKERLLAAFRDFLQVNGSPMAPLPDATLARALELCSGFRTFRDVEHKIGFAFQPDEAIAYDPAAVKKVLLKGDDAGYRMLESLLPVLDNVEPWTAAALEPVLQGFCNERGAKFGDVAQPIRVAVSGGTISPAIFETLELLGKDRTMRRIRTALTTRSAATP